MTACFCAIYQNTVYFVYPFNHLISALSKTVTDISSELVFLMKVAISPLSSIFCRGVSFHPWTYLTEAGFPPTKAAEEGISALGGGGKRKEIGPDDF